MEQLNRMEEFQQLAVKQEPEVNFVLILPIDDFIETFHEEKRISLKLKALDSRIDEMFCTFERCTKCGKLERRKSSSLVDSGCDKFQCESCCHSSKFKSSPKVDKKTQHKSRTSSATIVTAKKCLFCSALFSRQSMEIHTKKNHRDAAGYLQCPHIECLKSCKRLKLLKRHLSNVHVDVKLLTCSVCSKVFGSRESLNQHMREVHVRRERQAKFQCDSCAKIFLRKDGIRVHMKTHLAHRLRMFTCDRCGFSSSQKANLMLHLTRKIKKCFYCEDGFRCRRLLVQHYKEEHKAWNGNWRCQSCSKTFKKLGSLKIHQMRVCHGKSASQPQSIFECKKCPKTFKTSKNFKRHLRSIHGEVENRRCQICALRFATVDRLQLHLVNHKKLKTFKCHKCSHVFQWKHSLIKHLKTQHER